MSFSSPVQHELNTLFLGEKIGEGEFRAVYEHGFDPSLVVKIEDDVRRVFCNVAEWQLWQEAQSRPSIARWLAPCVAISQSGSVLIQKRTKPVTKMPDEMPDIFCDMHLGNVGRYRGRVVVHDYAFHRLADKALRTLNMRSPIR